MNVDYTSVRRGWIVQDRLGNVAEILDDTPGLVHRVRLISGTPSTIPEYAFNWVMAKECQEHRWSNVVRPNYIRPYPPE